MTALLLALLVTLIAYETKAWFPRILAGIVAVAVARLPKRQRERYCEEWMGDLESVPGGVARALHAMGFILASGRMFPRWRSLLRYKRSVARGHFASRVTTRALDLVFAVGTLVFLTPLVLAVATAVSLQGGPCIFRQRRIGRGGAPFLIYKFRTLLPASDGVSAPLMTPLGRFLRMTSIDEVPQLINVLRGEMSLIGPLASPYEVPDTKPGMNGGWHYEIEWKSSKPQPVYRWVLATISGYFFSLFYWVLTVVGRPPDSDAE